MCVFKLIKVQLLVRKLYMYQNARCNNKNLCFIYIKCSCLTFQCEDRGKVDASPHLCYAPSGKCPDDP